MAAVGDSGDSIKLNITPMMDVFSILIVFLLMSFSTDPVVVDPMDGLELPRSLTLSSLEEVPTLIVSKERIYVNERPIADIVNGDVVEAQRAQGAIAPLHEELKKLKEANDRVRESIGKEPKLGTITMEMDRTLPFVVARRVMLTASQSEFITFNLMTKKVN